jgi:hypothetical protein
MASTPNHQPVDSQTLHRRELFRQIILPLLGGAAFVALLLVITLLLPRRLQVSLISDFMLTCLGLCPAVICLFPLYVAMMVMAFGMNKVNDALARPLRRLENGSSALASRVGQVTDTINQKAVDLSVKIAPIEKVLDVFERPQDIEQRGTHEPDSHSR